MGSEGLIRLNAANSQIWRMVRVDQICALEGRKDESTITLHFIGGEKMTLSKEESAQFVQLSKGQFTLPDFTGSVAAAEPPAPRAASKPPGLSGAPSASPSQPSVGARSGW